MKQGIPKQPKKRQRKRSISGISRVIVQGYKSLARSEPYEISIRPLTLLAGANSSGKSSAIQPLLLLKQTLESSFDPGPLLLHGPHVRFTSTSQILPSGAKNRPEQKLLIGVGTRAKTSLVSVFRARDENEIELASTTLTSSSKEYLHLLPGLLHDEIEHLVPAFINGFRKQLEKTLNLELSFKVVRRRCFFGVSLEWPDEPTLSTPDTFLADFPNDFVSYLREIIHVPGLRGNPERSYPTTAVGSMFPGTFETYVASIIHQWQREGASALATLCKHLESLELTWKVHSRQLDATQVELKVGRLPRARRGGAQDLVNIADVGFGLSQVLPVIVALLTARPGQLVYLEQPEIHLHPKAQVALAEILADAARRGVRVVAETHSALLLLAVQALVAEGKLAREAVILHWFQRDQEGITQIATSELDEQGAYGDWPEDFGPVQLEAQGRYMSAVEDRLFRAVGG